MMTTPSSSLRRLTCQVMMHDADDNDHDDDDDDDDVGSSADGEDV